MELLIILLTIAYIVYLYRERRTADRDRASFLHVIYVNGTRGKSSVTRMIDGGLRALGYKVFCKTTGTDPMTIGVDGVERPIVRRGKANIKEQLKIMHQAAEAGAEILVIECMAVDPRLQYLSQHRMVKADIGVITNARLDHTDEMGSTVEEICNSLCSTVPFGGCIFTADAQHADIIEGYAKERGTEFYLACPEDGFELPKGMELEFADNIALALAVCEKIGADKDTALSGICSYIRDPYALSLYRHKSGAVFINGLSINDPQSSKIVWEDLKRRFRFSDKELILLINSRPDRGYRMEHMIMLAGNIKPDKIWLIGSFQNIARRRLNAILSETEVVIFKDAGEFPIDECGRDSVIFAVGNIANDGRAIIERIRKEGEPYVS